MGFWGRKQNRTISCQNVRLYVLKLHSNNETHSIFQFPKNYTFVSGDLSEDSEVGVAQLYCKFQGNQVCCDSHFCCVTMLNIDAHSGKKWTIFIFYVETPFLEKNTKAIVHGFPKMGFWGRKQNRIISFQNVSMCPDTHVVSFQNSWI